MLQLSLLGVPEIFLDEPPNLRFRTRKAQALLIYLAVTQRRWSRNALTALFWPEINDTYARKNLRDILPTLRRQVGDYLLLDDDSIGLDPTSNYKCDVTHFSTVLEQPLQQIETNSLAATLALYRGEFLEGYSSGRISAEFELWALGERERLHQLAIIGFTTLCRRQAQVGAFDAALITNRRLLKLAPWDEAAHRRQMMLLAQSGQQAAALAHFETCRQLLAVELDVEPDAETILLYKQIKDGQTNAGQAFAVPTAVVDNPVAAQPPPQSVPHNLPRQLTGLIGRTEEIDSVQRLLKEEHTALVTLVGQGGVGKTRLALAVAHYLRTYASEYFPKGIWFVPLTGVISGGNGSEQIAGAIAQAMALPLSGAAPLSTQLLRALQEQQLLLVLDNMEHLVAEQAFLLELLQTAQGVKVLCTSREQLHLHAEFLYPVTGLATPPASDVHLEAEHPLLISAAPGQPRRAPRSVDLGQYASVQLFVTRVQQRLPEFQLTAKNQQTIGLICRLLGGVPLGIELAAQLYVAQGAAALARLSQEIERLDPLDPPEPHVAVGLDHLQTPAIDLPPRQRSIRAVFLHSWRLLTPAEQALLCYSAIFRGGFTREAILTVADADGANLLALVMKSLVRRDSHDRYDLHELVRQYVIDQFQQTPAVVHAAAHKHAAFFTDLLAGQEEKLLQEFTFHQTIQTEIYNIRAAWAWCVDQRAFAELDRCVVCLFIYLRYAGQIHEALALAQQALTALQALPRDNPPSHPHGRLLGYLLIYAASAGIGAGLRAESDAWIEEALQLGETLGDAGLKGQIHATLMIKFSLALENRRSFAHAEQALQWVKAGDTPHLQPVILRVLAIGLARQGQVNESFQIAAELQQLIERRHYHCFVSESYFLTSTLYEIQRDWEAQMQAAQQGWEIAQASSRPFGLDNLEGNLIWAHLQLGNFAEARTFAQQFGTRARRTGKQAELLYSLQSLGHAAMGLGDWQAATTYLTDALKLAVAIDSPVRRVQIRHLLGTLSLRQSAYAQAANHFADVLQCAEAIGALELQILAQAGLALTSLHQKQPAQALQTVETILAAERVLTPDHPDYCFIGLAMYHVLDAHDDPRAAPILAELYREVQAQAVKIKSDAQRRRFLENIVEHRTIAELWAAR